MPNDLTKQGNGSTAVAQTGKDFFTQYGEAIRQTVIIGKLLKFSKGDWTAGEESEPIEEGTRFVANMDELLAGWVRWKDNKPTDHVMGRIADGYQPPKRNELGDDDSDQWEVNEDGEARDPWQMTNYLLLLDNEDNPYTFTTSSRGGLNAIGELCKHYGKQMRQHADEFPIIEIGVGSYQHANKAYGRIKFPTLDIVDWCAKAVFDDLAASRAEEDRSEEADNPGASPAPAPRQAAKPAPKQEQRPAPFKKAPAAVVAAQASSKAAPGKAKPKTRF
jgi:hypothetical protein